MLRRRLAKKFYGKEDNGVIVVGFADDDFSPREYLLLQRTLEPDEQDIELGHDLVHIELDNQRQSVYGGLELVQLSANEIRFEFNSEASLTLGVSEIVIDFSQAIVDRDHLKSSLSIVVDGETKLRFID